MVRRGSATDEDVHCVSCRADDHAKNDEDSADQGNVTSTHEIGEGANERADTCERQQIGKHLEEDKVSDTWVTWGFWPETYKPDPSVCATDIPIYIRWNSA